MMHNTDTTPTKVQKDTKLGVIPDGWTTPKINEVFQFINTTSFSRNQLNYDADNELFYIHYGDIHATYKKPLLDFEIENNIPRLNSDVELPNSVQYLQDGDVVIADASEDYEGVGEAIEMKNLNGKKVISGLHTFALRDVNNKTVAGFRTYIFKNPNVKKALKTIATGSKVYGISKGNIQKFKIVLPPLPEQQKIAQILATWDVAINKQEALIEEKRELKKGLMQQLLTGEKRFNEFSNTWKLLNFKDIVTINQGLQIAISQRLTEKIPNSFFYITNEFLKEGSSYKYYVLNPSDSVKCSFDDILMTRTGNTGQVVTNVEGVFHNNFFKINYNKEHTSKSFLFYFLTSDRTQYIIQKLAGTSTIPDLNHSDFYSIQINLPELAEQQKIGAVLTASDNQIKALQQQLRKLKTQKQGVMQQLLTGKIRVKI